MSFAAEFAVRDLHVSASPRECVRHVLKKLDPAKRKARAFRTPAMRSFALHSKRMKLTATST